MSRVPNEITQYHTETFNSHKTTQYRTEILNAIQSHIRPH